MKRAIYNNHIVTVIRKGESSSRIVHDGQEIVVDNKRLLFEDQNADNPRTRMTQHQANAHLKELWVKFNSERFEGKLKEIPIYLYGASRGLGVYYHGLSRRCIKIAERLFRNGRDEDLHDTIIHEMAHQYVAEVLNRAREGHGSLWKSVARKAGCTGQRLSTGKETETFHDKVSEIKKREERKELVEGEAKISPWLLKEGMAVKYLDTNKRWVKCVLACPNDKAGKRWAVATSWVSDRWTVIPCEWFYALEKGESVSDDLYEAAKKIKHHTEVKRQRRSGWGYFF